MFIKSKDKRGNFKDVNLKNVSTINVLWDSNRIAYNMNYSITIDDRNDKYPGKYGKQISDYVYDELGSQEAVEAKIQELLSNEYVIKWYHSWEEGFINVNEISSVKYEDYNNKIIVNLSNPVTFNKTDKYTKKVIEGITSDFVFMKFDGKFEYNNGVDSLTNSIQKYNEGK